MGKHDRHVDKELIKPPPHRPPKYTEKDIPKMLEAIEKAEGFKGNTAKLLGISSNTLNKYISLYPELQEKFDDVNQKNVDEVHNIMLDRIREGANGSHILMMFYLKAKGGWRDTTHIVQETHNFDWKAKLEDAAEHHPEIIDGEFVDDEDYSGW